MGPICLFCFYFHYYSWQIQKLLLQCMSKSVLSMISPRCFIVSSLTFRCLIHFEFIFKFGVRECSNSILLHVAVQLSQHHLLKRLIFSIVCSCLLCHRLIVHKCLGLFEGFLSCCIGAYVCFFASTTLPCLLQLCSIVWSQGAWFPPLFSSSRLLFVSPYKFNFFLF